MSVPLSSNSAFLVMLHSGLPEAPERGRYYELSEPELIIGSAEESHIQLAPQVAARQHARLYYDQNQWWLSDLTASNSILINGIPTGTFLFDQDGIVFKIGQAVFKLLLGKGDESECMLEMYRRNIIDLPTQVYNKDFFHRTLAQEVSRANRYHRDLSLAVFDLDHFRKVNTTWGHLAGDAVLKHAAQRMQQRARIHDTLARVGGEEFALILPETSLVQARECAEMIRTWLQQEPCSYEEYKIFITVSSGVASLSENMSVTDIYKQADHYLYQAKEKGRNRVESPAME